jgi:hypothetical protein
MPLGLGLAGLQELICGPLPAAASAVRPLYSNLDWLAYGLIYVVPVEIKHNISTKIEWNPFPLSII